MGEGREREEAGRLGWPAVTRVLAEMDGWEEQGVDDDICVQSYEIRLGIVILSHNCKRRRRV